VAGNIGASAAAGSAFGPWGTVIGAGLGLVGSILGGKQSAKGLRRQNQLAREEAQRNRDFQERMSSTAHQREVEDLREAGLNPILSGTGGMGASSPGGSMAAQVDEKTAAVATARELARTMAEIANMRKTGKLIDAQTEKTRSEKTLTDTTDKSRQLDLAEKEVSETIWDTLSQMFQTSTPGKPNLLEFIRDTSSSTAKSIRAYKLPKTYGRGPKDTKTKKRKWTTLPDTN